MSKPKKTSAECRDWPSNDLVAFFANEKRKYPTYEWVGMRETCKLRPCMGCGAMTNKEWCEYCKII